MEVEDVAREGLAAGRAAEQERHLPVGVRVLREVVVDAERVLAVVEEVLAHGAAREGRHPLDRSRLDRGGRDDDRVVHRAGLAQPLVDLRDRRGLLADRDVDADHVLALLVQDRVDQDRGLAGRAVADHELALAAADRDHRVDRLDAGLERLLHRLALDDAGRLELDRARLVGLDRPLAVERLAERVHDPADERVADRDAHDLAGALDRLALADLLPVAEERHADVPLLEVEGDTGDAVLELERLHGHAVLEAVDAGEAVSDLEDGADLRELGVDVVLLDPLLEERGDLFWAQLHVAGQLRLGSLEEFFAEVVQAAADARVDAERPGLEDEAADQVGIDGARRLDLALRGVLDLLARSRPPRRRRARSRS